nr:hypothetical protein [Tanacetum cinerariifolium]
FVVVGEEDLKEGIDELCEIHPQFRGNCGVLLELYGTHRELMHQHLMIGIGSAAHKKYDAQLVRAVYLVAFRGSAAHNWIYGCAIIWDFDYCMLFVASGEKQLDHRNLIRHNHTPKSGSNITVAGISDHD